MLVVICVQICHSKFTQKTKTCELCPSSLRTISLSIAMCDRTETRSNEGAVLVEVMTPYSMLARIKKCCAYDIIYHRFMV